MNDINNDSKKDYNIYNLLKLRELYMKRSTWIRDYTAPKNNMNIAAPRKNNQWRAACSGSLKNKK
jgi:hypothetical protein